MKICYLIPGCGVSGGIAVVCQHANRLKERGHEVYLVADGEAGDMGWFPEQNVPVLPLRDYPDDVDIVVATAWSTAFRTPLLPARRHFYFVQSDETRFHPEGSAWQHITRLSYTVDFHYLTEARWIRTWLLDNFGHRAALVPNGLDERIFFPCEPLQAKGKRPRILLEGAIGLPYKGMREAFLAVQDLDAEIWCVSSYGKPEAGWRCDRFFESVPMEEMRRIYSSCDVLLKLSRVEGFFGPPMEMMACGGAVVVGRVTGYDEYIVDGENALVVDAFDIDGAREAVRRLLTEDALRARLVANGKETAARWSWPPSIDALEKRFAEVLGDDEAAMTEGQQKSAQSAAFFYRQLRGEPCSPVTAANEENVGAPAAAPAEATFPQFSITPADRLIGRLQRQRWFHLLAGMLYSIYRLQGRIRGRTGSA